MRICAGPVSTFQCSGAVLKSRNNLNTMDCVIKRLIFFMEFSRLVKTETIVGFSTPSEIVDVFLSRATNTDFQV